MLRMQDVYLAASREDPSSNALLEGLACGVTGGVPAERRPSGAHGRGAVLASTTPRSFRILFARLRRGARRAPRRDPRTGACRRGRATSRYAGG